MERKLRIGFIGASRGMDFARILGTEYPFAEVAAVAESFDPLRDKTDAFLRERGIRAEMFRDPDEMLGRSGIDAVLVANYANAHAPFAVKALKHGIHVLSEVMPTQTPAEAAELADAVEKSGCVYAYAENYCYFDTCFAMRRLCEAGAIGEPCCLEGTFINDCSPKWEILTRGVRDHWRNYVPSTFYCSHSIGPMLYATGLRAVRVSGCEMQRTGYMAAVGARSGSAATELMELNNGAMARSTNGNLRRPYQAAYRIIGEDGTIECDTDGLRVFRYRGGFRYDIEELHPGPEAFPFRPKGDYGCIGNADTASMGYFIAKILGQDEGKYSIDVFRAADMALPGLMAYRSILRGGNAEKVPDLRLAGDRESARRDRYSTDPGTEAEYLLPTSKNGTPEVPDEVYEKVRSDFEKVNLTPGGK